MNKSLSEIVKELEDRNKELELLNRQYETMIKLLFYATRHRWVKDMIDNSEIKYGISGDCSKKEIQDYITYIEKYEDRLTVSKIVEKLDDPKDKVFVLSNFMNK